MEYELVSFLSIRLCNNAFALLIFITSFLSIIICFIDNNILIKGIIAIFTSKGKYKKRTDNLIPVHLYLRKEVIHKNDL
jgi:hypothetical protein